MNFTANLFDSKKESKEVLLKKRSIKKKSIRFYNFDFFCFNGAESIGYLNIGEFFISKLMNIGA